MKHQFIGNDAWVLSYREECFEQIGLKPSIKIPLYNGSLECEFRKYQMFDGKMKMFRSEGGTVKTDEEKRQMAERHRFRKEREFKQRITEQTENEDGDIRSFTFHRHELKDDNNESPTGRRERRFDHKDERDGRRERRFDHKEERDGRRDNRKDKRFDRKDSRFGRSENRGGHERFDRSGGKRKRNNFDSHDED